MFPLSRRIRVERWKLILDAAMVLAGGAVLVWYFAIRPTAGAHGDSATLTLLTYAFPLASFMLLLGITTVLLRGPLDRNREAFSCLVGGILVSIVSDLAFDLVLLETGERSASWTDARLHALLSAPHRQRRALLATAGGRRDGPTPTRNRGPRS